MTATEHTTPAARRRRLRVRVAMVGTLTGLAVSLATPAMAASAPTASAPAAVVPTAPASASHTLTTGAPKGSPKSDPKSPKHLTGQEKYQAYLDSAYTYDDAEQLAASWGTPSVRQAKVRIGGKLLTGVPLPFEPKAAPPKTAPKTGTPKGAPKTDPELADLHAAQLDAFYGAGYGYADAEVLASCWSSPSPYDAKLTGGAKIKAGSMLPFPPESASAAVDGDC